MAYSPILGAVGFPSKLSRGKMSVISRREGGVLVISSTWTKHSASRKHTRAVWELLDSAAEAQEAVWGKV